MNCPWVRRFGADGLVRCFYLYTLREVFTAGIQHFWMQRTAGLGRKLLDILLIQGPCLNEQCYSDTVE